MGRLAQRSQPNLPCEGDTWAGILRMKRHHVGQAGYSDESALTGHTKNLESLSLE